MKTVAYLPPRHQPGCMTFQQRACTCGAQPVPLVTLEEASWHAVACVRAARRAAYAEGARAATEKASGG